MALVLGVLGVGQAMLDAELLAQLVKLVIPRGLALTRGKQVVRELFAVVGQQFDNLERASLVQRFEEAVCAGRRFVFFDRHKHPARGPVDGYEQVAPAVLVGYLRQVFDIYVQVAWLVALERLVRFAWG